MWTSNPVDCGVREGASSVPDLLSAERTLFVQSVAQNHGGRESKGRKAGGRRRVVIGECEIQNTTNEPVNLLKTLEACLGIPSSC